MSNLRGAAAAGNSMQSVPSIKIINWSKESELPDDATRTLIRDETIYCSKKVLKEIVWKEDEDGEITDQKIGELWSNLSNIVITASVYTEASNIPELFLEPPALPVPFIAIQIRLNVDDDQYSSLVSLVSVEALEKLLPNSPRVQIDSKQALREVVTAVLNTDQMYSQLKPYLDEFGISKSAISPYRIVF